MTATKTILIFKGIAAERDVFCEHMDHLVVPRLADLDPGRLKMTLTRQAPPSMSLIPFSQVPVACVSVVGENPLSLVKGDPYFVSAHRVDEALPVAYNRTWPDGTPTPGVCLLTLFHKKPGLSHEEFIDRWHGGHTPLSLKIHPLWSYVRNQVTATMAGPSYDGVVEEQVQERRDLLNPLRFFGGPLSCLWNMGRTFVDVHGFLDYGRIETYLAEEIWYVGAP